MKGVGIGIGRQIRLSGGSVRQLYQPESALAIRLIPNFPRRRLSRWGTRQAPRNALLSVDARNEATEILRNVEYLELSGARFEQFAESMIF